MLDKINIYRAVFENAPDLVIAVDRDGRILRVNFEAERALCYGKNELIGLEVEILIPSRFVVGHVENREKILRCAASTDDQWGRARNFSPSEKTEPNFP